jgi:alpha-1,2-mannosyltransferase
MGSGWRRVATTAAFGGAAGWFAWEALHRPLRDRQADLQVYYGAVHAVAHGGALYSYGAPNGGPFTYPPFALLLFWPVGWLPLAVLRVVWTVVTCAAVVGLAAVLFRRMPWLAALALLVSAPLQSNLRFGQVSVFVVLVALVDAAGLVPQRWRGVLVGLAAAVKLTPLVFVPYFLVTGQRRAALRATGAFLAAAALAAVVLPGDSVDFWTHAVFTTSRVGDVASAGNQSLNGMLLRMPVLPSHREVALAALCAVVCGAALYRSKWLYDLNRPVEAAVTTGCASLAVSPVSWTHHQVWTVLAGLLLFTRRDLPRRTAAVVVLLAMTWRVPGLSGFLSTNARGLCAVGICCLGLVAAWRAARTPVLTLGGRFTIRARALAAGGAVGLVVAGFAVATGIISVVYLQPYMLTSPRWQAAIGRATDDPAAPPITYTSTDPHGLGVVKAVGATVPRVRHLVLRVTPQGPEYTVPLFAGPVDGTHVFAFAVSANTGTLVAYDARGRRVTEIPVVAWVGDPART